jgi:hypothetical protein
VIYIHNEGASPKEHKAHESEEYTMKTTTNTYRLPQTTTPEELEMNGIRILNFGDQVLLAGHCFSKGKDYWYGAAYTFTTKNHTCEGEVRLTAVSDKLFEDDGHAIEWAMKH